MEAARARGIETQVLREGEDPFELARRADASALGMAGGDGSLAPVAAAALERDLPFVCVPFGTYNHFAWDAGLDRDDPLGALDAFGARERRVDVGRAGDDGVFLNTVSFGLYAALVAEEDRVGTRVGAAARLVFRPKEVHLRIDGEPVTARIVVVGNNEYRLHPLEVGRRPRLDGGISTSASREACCRGRGRSGARRASRSTRRGRASRRRSTASRFGCGRPSSSGSSHGRYGCCSRKAARTSGIVRKASLSGPGRSSRSNQRSSETSSAARASPRTILAVQYRFSVPRSRSPGP